MAKGKRPMLMKQPKGRYAPLEGADGDNPLQATGVARPVVNRALKPPGAPEGALSPTPARLTMPAPVGATDGLGAGQGGLAVHSSAKGANIHGYEPQHSSKRR